MEVDHSKNDDVNTKLLQEFKDQSTFNPNKKKGNIHN